MCASLDHIRPIRRNKKIADLRFFSVTTRFSKRRICFYFPRIAARSGSGDVIVLIRLSLSPILYAGPEVAALLFDRLEAGEVLTGDEIIGI